MKKVFISLIIASLFVACSDNKKEEKTKNEQVKEEVKAPLNQRITIIENKTVIEKDNPFISYDYDGNRVVKISPSGEETALTKD
jgi:ABC-type molybdate transport system substrate-binding protein